MGALKDPNASYTVDSNYYGTKSAKSGSPTSAAAVITPQAVLGKTYTKGRYAVFLGNITTLTEGKTVTVALSVNGELKAQQNYTAKGFLSDPDNDVVPCMDNVSDLDEISIAISSDDATDSILEGCKLLVIAGEVASQLS